MDNKVTKFDATVDEKFEERSFFIKIDYKKKKIRYGHYDYSGFLFF